MDEDKTEAYKRLVYGPPDDEEPVEEQGQEEPTVYYFPDDLVEVHMIGEYVAVCWRLRKVEKTIPAKGKAINNIIVTETHYERSGEPYIDFLEIRQCDGEFYIGKNNPVVGGISPAEALVIAKELEAACAYLVKLGKT